MISSGQVGSKIRNQKCFDIFSGSMFSAQIKNHPKSGQDYVKQHAVHNHTHTHLKNWLWKRDKSAQTFFSAQHTREYNVYTLNSSLL